MINQMRVRVMVVEDETEVRDEYRRLIKERSILQLVAETDDPDEALQLLEVTTVDALILDLEMPRGSGILLLEKLNTMQIEKPFIAVVTNVVSKVIYDAIRNMGVDYICAKGDPKFSLAVPLSIIEISAPYRKTKERAELISGKLNARTRRDLYGREIEFELSRFGFSLKMLGTSYIQEALMFLVMSDIKEISMTKEMYPYIASKFKTNPTNVERNIRIAIEKVWTEKEVKALKELYSYEWNMNTGRPTNAEFLYNIAKKLTRQ